MTVEEWKERILDEAKGLLTEYYPPEGTNVLAYLDAISGVLAGAARENELTKVDLNLDDARDSSLQRIYGSLLQLAKDPSLDYYDYRFMLKMLFWAFMQFSTTEEGIKRVVSGLQFLTPEVVVHKFDPPFVLGQNALGSDLLVETGSYNWNKILSIALSPVPEDYEVFVEGADKFWVGGPSGQIVYFDQAPNSFESRNLPVAEDVRCIDGCYGEVWVATENHVYVWRDGWVDVTPPGYSGFEVVLRGKETLVWGSALPALLRTSNGFVWSLIPVPPAATLLDFAYSEGHYYILFESLGSYYVWQGTDPSSLTATPLSLGDPFTPDLDSPVKLSAFGRFVVVLNDDGRTAISDDYGQSFQIGEEFGLSEGLASADDIVAGSTFLMRATEGGAQRVYKSSISTDSGARFSLDASAAGLTLNFDVLLGDFVDESVLGVDSENISSSATSFALDTKARTDSNLTPSPSSASYGGLVVDRTDSFYQVGGTLSFTSGANSLTGTLLLKYSRGGLICRIEDLTVSDGVSTTSFGSLVFQATRFGILFVGSDLDVDGLGPLEEVRVEYGVDGVESTVAYSPGDTNSLSLSITSAGVLLDAGDVELGRGDKVHLRGSLSISATAINADAKTVFRSPRLFWVEESGVFEQLLTDFDALPCGVGVSVDRQCNVYYRNGESPGFRSFENGETIKVALLESWPGWNFTIDVYLWSDERLDDVFRFVSKVVPASTVVNYFFEPYSSSIYGYYEYSGQALQPIILDSEVSVNGVSFGPKMLRLFTQEDWNG